MDEPGCRAFCLGCFQHCPHDEGHEGAHEAEHWWLCSNPKFFVAKVCKLCRKVQIRADWDICRPCALVIELQQARDPETVREIMHEMLSDLISRRRLSPPIP